MAKEKKDSPEVFDEISALLKTVANHFELEDLATRERQIRRWRRLKLYWNNFSQIYWSETAHDYKLFNSSSAGDTNQDYYDKPVNVFKAFLETIIAALSIQIPAINCVPDDAENPLDMSTAKAGDKIAELIYKHNNAIFLWLHALYIYCTEGMIACYSYADENKKYGTYDKPEYKDEEIEARVCPYCGVRVPDEIFSANELDEFQPSDDDVEIKDVIENEGPICFECGAQLDPELQKTKLIIPRFVGITKEAKSKVVLEVYGGLYVKVANYARTLEGSPYLRFSHETHYVNAMESYPDIKDSIPQGGSRNSGSGVNDPYEQYGRLNTQYRGEFPDENVTINKWWLRPASFNILPQDQYEVLKKRFPDGAKFVMVNDVPAEYKNESLDDYWTTTENPMSDYLNHEPLGELLTNIQDITNDLISLTIQTIEQGIAQTFADPAVVNFTAQKQLEAQPGTITPTKPVAGTKSIAESFYSIKQAALSPETLQFYQIIQQLGQFTSGALPSLFGGAQAGGSNTASEYAMSKGMALQRLQTPWRMMSIWWKTIFSKAIPLFMNCMVEDERLVEKDDKGNFINVFIRKAEIDGKIGSVELETSDKLPITDEQQADMIMQLFTLNNEEITRALMDPDNIPYIAKVVKIPSFKLPGGEDRQKQYEEIVELVNSAPIPPDQEEVMMYQEMAESGMPIPPEITEPQEESSVPIDVDVDNHEIEASICKSWLISSAGRLAKQENPNGYKNVLLHMKAHIAEIQKAMQSQMMHDDQLALATGKTTSGSQSSSGLKSPAAKSKEPKKVNGESSARKPVE